MGFYTCVGEPDGLATFTCIRWFGNGYPISKDDKKGRVQGSSRFARSKENFWAEERKARLHPG
jgi:hypothetical protein